jgi:predicted permease
MRLLKFLLSALFTLVAVLAGLFVTAAVAAIALGALFGRRLFRSSSRRPAASAASGTQRPTANVPDTIDVVATEVPADRIAR